MTNKLILKINQNSSLSDLNNSIDNFIVRNSKITNSNNAQTFFKDSVADLLNQGKNSFTSGSNLHFERTIVQDNLTIEIKGNFSQKKSIFKFIKDLIS